jgi:hypothetical protein
MDPPPRAAPPPLSAAEKQRNYRQRHLLEHAAVKALRHAQAHAQRLFALVQAQIEQEARDAAEIALGRPSLEGCRFPLAVLHGGKHAWAQLPGGLWRCAWCDEVRAG